MADLARSGAVHVIAGLDAAHGGPSYSVPRLCQALVEAGVETTLLTVAGAGEAPADVLRTGYQERRFAWNCAHVPVLKGLRRSRGLASELNSMSRHAGLIHNHGLWLMPNVYAGRTSKSATLPFVVSPRGMLSAEALKFSGLKKRIFWRLLQGHSVRAAACIHATSEAEYEDVRAFGLLNPVAIIPNGIDLPDFQSKALAPGAAERTVLSLGRLHPKKGLDRLVRAWAELEPQNPNWRLRIIGPAEGNYDLELRALAATLGLSRVSIEPALYGEAKLSAYRDADIFVLPTLNENFGVTVAESLAAGTPVISTKGAPWSGLEANHCGWWIDHGVQPLGRALAKAVVLNRQELKAMGARGRGWMERDFAWKRVGQAMAELYMWLQTGTSRPTFVRVT